MQADQTGGKAGEGDLLALLERHAIAYSMHRHPPLFTVEDSRALRGDLPGVHVKNMFLKEKKGGLWLVTCREDRQVRIRDLERAVGAKNTSFGKPDLLMETLGVTPGAVTPFAVINDVDQRVRVVLDPAILRGELVNAHPLHNEATIALAPADLLRVFEITGHAPIEADFDALEALRARSDPVR